MPTFHIATFGCRANQADSAAVRENLQQRHFEETESAEAADIIIVNSCTVTHGADRQVRQLIRKMHRVNPAARIMVTGCYAQRRPQELAQINGVSAVVGNTHKETIGDLLSSERLVQDGTYCGPVRIHHSDIRRQTLFHLPPAIDIGEKTRPFLKIQDGCDARCSYCIIPAVRGPARSAPPEDIVSQINRLVEQGYQEVVLSGIHMGTYGWKLEAKTSLSALLEKILAETRIRRLRLSSIEPMKFSTDLIRLAAATDRLAPHFHLPLQSGCNRILRLMRRPYRAERFAQLLDHIYRLLPEAAIGTDVITGFPGETDAEFEETLRRVEEMPLTYVHVFTYSPREGTAAVRLADAVPEKTAQERSRRLRQLSALKNLAFRRRFLGRSLSVLTLSDTGAGEAGQGLMALSANYLKVKVCGAARPNELLEAHIFALQDDYLVASPESGVRASTLELRTSDFGLRT